MEKQLIGTDTYKEDITRKQLRKRSSDESFIEKTVKSGREKFQLIFNSYIRSTS